MFKSIAIVFFVLIASFQICEMKKSEEAIPEKFLGAFELVKSEGFEDYLGTKGLDVIKRKIICHTPITYVFEKGSKPGTYTLKNLSSKRIDYVDWKLGETFDGEGMDNTNHKITFSMPDENTLGEHYLRYEVEGDNEELYHYTREGDYLIQTMSNKGVTAKRWHKLVDLN